MFARLVRFPHLSIMVAPEYPETRFPGLYVAASWATGNEGGASAIGLYPMIG